MSQNKHIIGRMNVNHTKGDALTAFSVNDACTRMVTADSAGRIKMWDVSETDWLVDGQGVEDEKIPQDFKKHSMDKNMRVKWFIQAHKALINTINVVEVKDAYDDFVLTAGNDCNILLHRLSNG